MTANRDTSYERERRFLVSDETIIFGWPWVLITQAYLWTKDGYASRVRLIEKEDDEGDLVPVDATHAIKGPRIGDERFEAEAPLGDFDVARSIIDRASFIVRKRRYQVVDTEAWDVDLFLDDNEGLVIAELEGTNVREVRRPDWCSFEITTKDAYNNENLAVNPWRRWPRAEKSNVEPRIR